MTMDRIGPRHCLASSRAALESLGHLAGQWPRPESYGGAAVAGASAVLAGKVIGLVADAATADDGVVVAVPVGTAPSEADAVARDDPETQLFFLVACSFVAGVCASTWMASVRAEVRRVIDPRRPASPKSRILKSQAKPSRVGASPRGSTLSVSHSGPRRRTSPRASAASRSSSSFPTSLS